MFGGGRNGCSLRLSEMWTGYLKGLHTHGLDYRSISSRLDQMVILHAVYRD